MYRGMKNALFGGLLAAAMGPNAAMPGGMEQVPVKRIDLAEWLVTGKLKPVNREVAKLRGSQNAVHVDEKIGPGVVWIGDTDFVEGILEVDVRGRDVFQKSFVGIAFHGKDDNTYEAVYVRPFNFRAGDPARHRHAVQYMASPQYDWPRLREEFPDEFENPVDPVVAPDEWVHLRVVVRGATVQVYVGAVKSPTLSVRKLGQQDRGMIGLWTGNNSDGDFSDLRITSAAPEPKP
jgi:hypothetical protein